ncbi:MAG: GldG family protein [Sandaracinaceae bacterium]|nr:GldG family protein [Sandaracinaceae bacterium]
MASDDKKKQAGKKASEAKASEAKASETKAGAKPETQTGAKAGAKAGAKVDTKASDKKTADAKSAAKGPELKSSGKGLRKGAESITYLLIALAILVFANIAGYFVFARFDVTEARLYSLSDGSRRLVGDLEDDLQITAYLTADLPPPLNATERTIRDLLAEYVAASGGRIHVRYVSPDEDAEKREAEEAGVTEDQQPVFENDSVTVRRLFHGLVIRYRGDRKTIPVIRTTEGLEYQITSNIQQLVREDFEVGILSGHDAPTPTKGMSKLGAWLPAYRLREVDATQEIDRDLRALLIVAPESRLSETELRRINQYVMRGGSLGVFAGGMKIDLGGEQSEPTATRVDTGLNDLLQGWGVRVQQDLVADADCGQQRIRGMLGLPMPVPYPLEPIIHFDEEQQRHPVAFRLPQVQFLFGSSIQTTPRFRELGGVVLGRTSTQTAEQQASWRLTSESVRLTPRPVREWLPELGQPNGPHTVMVALSGRLPNAFASEGSMSTSEGDAPRIEAPARAERDVRVFVVGTGTPLLDPFVPPVEEQGQQGSQIPPGLALTLNAVDWLAQDLDLIAIRAKRVEDPAIEEPRSLTGALQEAVQAQESGDADALREQVARLREASEEWDRDKLNYKIGMTILVPLLVLLLGLGRWGWRAYTRGQLEELRRTLAAKKKATRARRA